MNDLISRSALLEHVRHSQADNPFHVKAHEFLWHNTHSHIVSIIKQFPAVKPEPVQRGWWEPVIKKDVFGGSFIDGHVCSLCAGESLSHYDGNYEYDEILTPYCPYCGARMMEVEG